MLDGYIKELIASNNRVIIPNFGAFLLRATSKNKNKKVLAEKIDDIYFSPFLKFNDELLVNHIIEKEGVHQEEAMERINSYVKSIEEQVQQAGSYTLEEMGSFYMDQQGKIQFKVNPTGSPEGTGADAASGAAAGDSSEQVSAKGQEGSEKEKQGSTGASTGGKTAPQGSETAQANKRQGEKAAGRTTGQEKRASAQAAGGGQKATGQKKGRQSSTAQKKTGPRSTGPRGTAQAPPPPPNQQKQTEKSGSKGNRGLILSIAIGVPVAAVFIWAMINFDTVQNLFQKESGPGKIKQTTEQKEPSKRAEEKKAARSGQEAAGKKEPSAKQSPGQAQEKKSETTASQKRSRTDQSQQAARGGKKYYLVAGSFKNKENAVHFHQKLLDQGYQAEIIDERDGMHAVSYSSFQNKEKARAELRRLRQQGHTAWLLYH